MANVIVAFSRPENGRSIKSILIKNGYHVVSVCTSGAQVLAAAGELDFGIIVCGGRFEDMTIQEMCEDLPGEAAVLLVAAKGVQGGLPERAILLSHPLKVYELVNAMEMVRQNQERQKRKRKFRPGQRTEEEKSLILKAKRRLMEENYMTEEEAHQYIQRNSMNQSCSMAEMAQRVIMM